LFGGGLSRGPASFSGCLRFNPSYLGGFPLLLPFSRQLGYLGFLNSGPVPYQLSYLASA
jgi:hypothetical protein